MTALPPPAPWRSLLSGARRTRALAAAESIAAHLVPLLPAIDSPTLGRGTAGVALAYAYLSEVSPGAGHEEVADEQLARAITSLAEDELEPSFFGGYSGVAWIYDLVAESLHGEPPDPEALVEIDEALHEHLSLAPTLMSHELISGIAGMAIYALGRSGEALGRQILQRVLAFLEVRAEITADGASWATTPFMMRNWAGGSTAHTYNLGLSHGVPGTIGILGGMLAAGVEPERTRVLLISATRWLLRQIRPTGPAGLGYHAGDPGPGRVAWCYGDLGVAAMLAWLGRVLDDHTVFEAARSLGHRVAARDQIGEVADIGLCHGAAGNAHCFNRLWQATGDPVFEAAANTWIDHALSFGGPTLDVPSLLESPTAGDLPLTGFLERGPGVIAALAAASSDVEPRWDRALLLSVPRANREAKP